MGTDFFLKKGDAHLICQDYVMAGTHNSIEVAALADGCSGYPNPAILGSPNTDFGARFLIRAAIENIEVMACNAFFAADIITRALEMSEKVGLHNECLDATLLTAVRVPHGVRVFQTGDGVVAARKRTGEVHYFTRSFDRNAPFYLSYLLQQSLVPYLNEVKEVEKTEGLRDLSGAWNTSAEVCRLVESDLVESYYFSQETYDVVLLLSDGVESFTTANRATVPVHDVLDQIFDFKGLIGEFLVRRCNRFFTKFCVENGWKHYDDFSVAGIAL